MGHCVAEDSTIWKRPPAWRIGVRYSDLCRAKDRATAKDFSRLARAPVPLISSFMST